MFEVVAVERPVLSVSGVTSAAATLNIANYGEDWRYKADKAPHNACFRSADGKQRQPGRPLQGHDIRLQGVHRRRLRRRQPACPPRSSPVGGVAVGNMSEMSDGDGIYVIANNTEATGFTTGNHAGGYTLNSVVVKLRDSVNNNPGDFAAAIYCGVRRQPGGDRAPHAQRQRHANDRGQLHLHLFRDLQPGQEHHLLPGAFWDQPGYWRRSLSARYYGL